MDPAPFIAAVSNRWRSFRSRWIDRAPLAPHLALGRRGEQLAAAHLRRRGYKVLYRNFRSKRGGEIDLVCRHGEVLVFVEVKTRSDESLVRPAAAVDRRKQRRLARGAMAWLRLLDSPDIPFRFDIVEVILAPAKPPDIRVLESAFNLPTGYLY